MTVFTVDEVMACPRPRHMRNGHTYMPTEYTHYKRRVAEAYLAAGGGHMGAAPVALTIDVMRVSSEPDTVRPDVDNIAKGVMDALNGVAYDDDAQVVSLCVLKCERMRGCPDRMRVNVRAMDEGDRE